MRREVQDLAAIGPWPRRDELAEDLGLLEQIQDLVDGIEPPVSDSEALALAALFGPDEGFGLAWSLVHLIESAPGWPMVDGLPKNDKEWVQLLRKRAARGSPST